MALFCTTIRRDTVFLLMFTFRGHVLVFSCSIVSVCRSKSQHICFPIFVFLFLLFFCLVLFANAVTGYYDVYPFVLFYVILESFYYCVYHSSMLANKLVIIEFKVNELTILAFSVTFKNIRRVIYFIYISD